jgi:hypothetical protein
MKYSFKINMRKILKIIAIIITVFLFIISLVFFMRTPELYFVLAFLFCLISTLIYLKRYKLLLLVALHPIFICPVIYSIGAVINYTIQTPVIMNCCSMLRDENVYDKSKKVYLEYMDDDCDWDGLYLFTIDVNNFITNRLLDCFGYPNITYKGGFPDLKSFCKQNALKEDKLVMKYKDKSLIDLNNRYDIFYYKTETKAYDYNKDLILFAVLKNDTVEYLTLFLKEANRNLDICECE